MEELIDYIKISEAAQMWGVTERRVQVLCASGKIEGVIRLGRDWMIPKSAKKPPDGRYKAVREAKANVSENADVCMPMPRKTPVLSMTDLYRMPGTADECTEKLSGNPEAQVLFEAEIAYSRGDIDKVYEYAQYLLDRRSGFFAMISAGMLLAKCAIWKGDSVMWNAAKHHIFKTPVETDFEREVILLTACAVNIMLYNASEFPEWFKSGRFESLPTDSLPAARVYYAKYLYATGYSIATGAMNMDGVQGITFLRLLPFVVEPMIAQARATSSVIEEICLHMSCAAAYHNIGNDAEAIRHVDRAIELALPDRFYGLLAEYFRVMDSLLEQRLESISPEICGEIRALYRVYDKGWARLSGDARGKKVISTLSPKEREVTKLVAFGLSNPEIADKLNMSVSVVKQTVRIIMEKSGLTRKDFAQIL